MDFDRDQAGPAAPYLRLDEKELLTIRNSEFAGRKAIWVPHKDEEKSYVKALVQGDGKKPNTKSVEFEGITKDFKVNIFLILNINLAAP